MSLRNLPKSKYFIILLASLGFLGLLSIYIFYIPTRDAKDELQIMKLRKDAAPTFKLESQLLYTPSLLKDFNAEDTLIETINITIDMDSDVLEQVSTDISALSSFSSRLTLSLFPTKELDEETYIALCEKLYYLLGEEATSKTEFILYPQDLSRLDQYDTLSSHFSMGITIDTLQDLKKLETISKHFRLSHPLYVRENFIQAYAGDISGTIREINAFYYILAIRYPEVTGIFSSFIKGPWSLENDFSLKPSDPNYAIYQNVYGRLLNEPWLTTKDVPLNTTSPYELLSSYDELTGMEKLILSPDSTLITGGSKVKSSTYSDHLISYKWENEELTIQNYYPYLVQLDTTTAPNGVTRLKTIASNSAGELVEVQSIDLMIDNENTLMRAKRYLDDISFDTSPSYGSSYIPILMYHSIADEVAKEDNNHTVQTKLFDAQMKALIDHGYTPINFKMLDDYLEGKNGLPEKPILITMDDGYLNNYTHAYPIYKKYHISATLFVSPYYMREDNTDRHFGWKAAKEMEDSGLIDIQSHGYDHTPLRYLSLKDVRYHVSHSKGLIEKYLGPRDVFVVAYPQFRNTIYTRKLLSKMGVDFQITKLAKRGTGLKASNLKRINVPNTMSPEELIATLENLTQ